MVKYLKVIVVVILLLSVVGCSIRTPEIRGVVLDEETRRPVEGAWVHATLELKTKTIQGNVYNVLSVDRPHTRTGRDGRFMIPSRRFNKPFPPVGFGTEVMSFGVSANTVDWRGGGLEIKDLLGKEGIELVIQIRSAEKDDEEKIISYMKGGVKRERAMELIEMEYFSSLQALYRYCNSGRFSVEVPPVEGGCDDWELDYAIAKHERYLERYKDPKIIEKPPYGVSRWDNIIHYSNILDQLAHLFKKKGDYKKALNIFYHLYEFDKKHGLSLRLKDYEREINELQKRLEGGKK